MELSFASDTMCGTNCVSELTHELMCLESVAATWEFPYSIGIVVRCGANFGKTFRRFEKSSNSLIIDIREKDSDYIALSRNEQRERLGKIFFDYFKETLNKYPSYATALERDELISNIENWLTQNNWLNGKIEQARMLLKEDKDLFEVSKLLDMSLEEIEDIFLAIYETEERTQIHADNILTTKGWVYR